MRDIELERFAAIEAALMGAEAPSLFFRALKARGSLGEWLPELSDCVGVPQNPAYHPEGDVFEHTMLVADCAAALRARALNPAGFMWAALCHDLGKAKTTCVQADGRITSYQHETAGMPLCEAMLSRLGAKRALIDYAVNMTWLHMRPNILAKCKSKRKKTRVLFDLSLCPEDLILLARADASGKGGEDYDPALEAFLRERLEDYRQVMARPMATEADLLAAGVQPGAALDAALARTRSLHFSGLNREKALKQAISEWTGRTVRAGD